jgi:hypothetical protein
LRFTLNGLLGAKIIVITTDLTVRGQMDAKMKAIQARRGLVPRGRHR